MNQFIEWYVDSVQQYPLFRLLQKRQKSFTQGGLLVQF